MKKFILAKIKQNKKNINNSLNILYNLTKRPQDSNQTKINTSKFRVKKINTNQTLFED
jgi:hypothetical protein